MHFLPDVWVTCEACGGTRYTAETLAVKFRGKTIADVLDMSVAEGLELFASVPKIRKVLQTLHDVGLGYVPLGQSAPTLSGGEAQRVKLAAELARPDTGKTLYVLDEPTTGLHLDDVRKLLDVIHRLADLGNTVIVIEHNLEVVKTADWLIDLGPEAGQEGGEVVVAGPPEVVAAEKRSLTGVILKGILSAGPKAERARFDPKAAARKLIDEAKKAAAEARAVGGDVKPPWELDGRAWHTRDRLARNGKAVRWDGRILELVVDRAVALGRFAPVDWSQRAVVKLSGVGRDAPVFFTAMTGHEWVLTLKFRVGRNTFQQAPLAAKLKLTAFHEAATPVLSDAARLVVSPGSGPIQDVTITAHSLDELETPAFHEFLVKAVASFQRLGESGALMTASEMR
jgi:excinuclease ABC subunit A